MNLSNKYFEAGRLDEAVAAANAALNRQIADWEQELSYNIAYVLAYRDENDLAFTWLEKAVEYGDGRLYEISTNSLFANIHFDPRWPALLQRIGMAKEQLDAVEFELDTLMR